MNKKEFLEPVKGIYKKKLILNIILNSERLKMFLLRSGTRERCLASPLLVNIVLENLGHIIRQAKEIKRIQILKKEIQLLFFCKWHDCLHRES